MKIDVSFEEQRSLSFLPLGVSPSRPSKNTAKEEMSTKALLDLFPVIFLKQCT
jgi:hypothetical protein